MVNEEKNKSVSSGGADVGTGLRRPAYIACCAVFGVALSVLCVFLAVYAVVFNRQIYHNSMVREAEYFWGEKDLTDEQVSELNSHGLTQAQLDYVMDDVLKYLLDGRETLDTGIEGYEGELFSETEISHMVDVKAIFTAIKLITIICAVLTPLSFAGLIAFDRARYRSRHKRIFIITLAGNAAFIGALTVSMLISFQDLFIFFHEVLFNNDNWMLYSTDLLIEMLPESLFMRLGFYISAVYVLLLLAFCLAGIFQKRISALFKKAFAPKSKRPRDIDIYEKHM